MPDHVLTTLISAGSAIVGAVVASSATIFQLRQQRWERAGDVDRSDASTLWQTQTELVRQLLSYQTTLVERLDRLTDRLDNFGNELLAIGAQVKQAAAHLSSLAESSRRTEAAIKRLNGESLEEGGV